ncbi:hypothetical protein [Actinoplanes utahensis]|nr:hypothetical protein [Actinoplanes utahensis]GIF33939.1 hypothetical protein Aut01nite_69250 [Actinoplanes utahensis]
MHIVYWVLAALLAVFYLYSGAKKDFVLLLAAAAARPAWRTF